MPSHSWCQVTAAFSVPDTVCVNQDVFIQNLSTNATTYYWNFCSGNLVSTPFGQNLGNLGNLNKPVYSALAKDGNNHFSFITNLTNGTIARNSYGSSFANAPISLNIGNLGSLPSGLEGIQIKKDSNTWYGLLAGGMNVSNIYRLDFGASLMNTPTVTNYGNIGSVFDKPHTIYTFKENGNWYSLVGNYGSSTLARLDFGNSLSNTPTAVNLGNIGNLDGPVGLYPILDNGNWYLFVTNKLSNSISRLNFGSSLTNIPTGINMGNLSGTLHSPRSITILRDCGIVHGFLVNEDTDDLVRLDFPNGITSVPTGISLGNIAGFDFPHHISEIFRENDDLYVLVTNVYNNTLSRLKFQSCVNASTPSSNVANPPVYSYNSPGTYNINLVVDEGMPTQQTICKSIVVVTNGILSLGSDSTICQGDTIILTPTGTFSSYNWSTGSTSPSIPVTQTGLYWLNATTAGTCMATDSIFISVNPSYSINNYVNICQGQTYFAGGMAQSGSGIFYDSLNTVNYCDSTIITHLSVIPIPQVNLGPDIYLCAGDSAILTAGSGFNSYHWSNGSNLPQITVQLSGEYFLTVTNSSNCSSSDSIQVIINPLPYVNLGNDTTICFGDSIILDAGPGFLTYEWNDGSALSTLLVNSNGQYWVTVTNSFGCQQIDSISINVIPLPAINLGTDTVSCIGLSVLLDPGNSFSTYLWNTGSQNQIITVTQSGYYAVTVSYGLNCVLEDDIQVDFINGNMISLGPDTSLCNNTSILLSPGSGFATYVWNNGQQTSSILATQSGNYSVSVTRTDGCFDADSIHVGAYALFNINITPSDPKICQGSSVTLTAQGALTYQWLPVAGITAMNDSSFVASPTFSTYYSVIGKDQYGCLDSVNFLVMVNIPAISYLKDSISACYGLPVVLDPMPSQNNLSYLWSTGDTANVIEAYEPGLYWVYMTDGICLISDSTWVTECLDIWLPNVFTPNYDGSNDLFYPVGKIVPEYEMFIFNRWGKEVYHSTDFYEGWDGNTDNQACAEGIYFFVAYFNGPRFVRTGEKDIKSGTLSLFR